MDDLTLLIVIGSAVVVASIMSPLVQRFKSDELADKRQLDWRLLAAENSLDFIVSSKKINQFLRARLLHLDVLSGVASNAISIQEETSTVYFFDYQQKNTQMNSGLEMSRYERIWQGVCIQFERREYPRLYLAKLRQFQDTGYVSIHQDLYPEWVPKSIQIRSGRNEAKEIARFVESNIVLKKIINHKNFSAILFRGSSVAVYFNERLPVEKSSLDQLKQWAQDISEIADPQMLASDPEIQVKLLKKKDRNQSDQKAS